jgi:UPF0755 protein
MLRIYIFYACAVVLVVVLFFTLSPTKFPTGSIVTVPAGIGLYTLAERLQSEQVIRSPFWFRAVAILLGGERQMKAGQYFLTNRQNVFVIAWRVFHGRYDLETVKLTIPEGFNIAKIVALFDHRFLYFNHQNFMSEAPEGYLFPDTYFIPINATASSTIKLLGDNFTRQVEPLLPDIVSSRRTLEEIIVMASLLEAEANNKEDRHMVSDILWKRLTIGMPLQVDSDIGTYQFMGLPPKPINNPGLESIRAAIHPIPTPYLYFLTGKDGKMHYAKTFDEHKKNIATYLVS